jgi:hypothetical protein
VNEALSDPEVVIYFDAQVTSGRASAVKAPIASGNTFTVRNQSPTISALLSNFPNSRPDAA